MIVMVHEVLKILDRDFLYHRWIFHNQRKSPKQSEKANDSEKKYKNIELTLQDCVILVSFSLRIFE
jgi:hypothetical protein